MTLNNIRSILQFNAPAIFEQRSQIERMLQIFQWLGQSIANEPKHHSNLLSCTRVWQKFFHDLTQ